MEQIGAMLGGRLCQIAIVVSDLDAALRRSAELFGELRWRCYVFGPNGSHEYHGAPATFSVRLALNDETPQMELIQPLEGDSVHRDWLAEHGEGLHHIAFAVPSMERAIAAMAALGIPIQSGTGFGARGDGDGAYAYFDSIGSLGVIVEAIEQPSSLPEPATIWP